MRTKIIRYKGQLGTIVSDYYNREIEKFLPMNYGQYYSNRLETIENQFITKASTVDKIKFITQTFVWGEVVQIHIIGEYQIIEYIKEDGKSGFHPYINFNDISHSYNTLDESLIGVISYKYDGCNSQASLFFNRMIGDEISEDTKKYYY